MQKVGAYTMSRLLSGAALASLLIGLPAIASAADLDIWWVKGITEKEDKAFLDIIADWEAKTGKDAEVSFYATRDIETKVIAALEAGSPPDVTFSFGYDVAYTPTWAFEGKLADVTEVIGPLEEQFQESAVESVTLLNGETGERSYYAIPWAQMTPHVHYWHDLLEKAGFTEDDIPEDWNAFFSFWCDEVQPALREQGERIYGLGLGTGTASNDPFFNVHIFMNAHGAEIVDDDGELLINDPEVKAKVVEALASFTEPSLKKCVPPDAVNWGGADDNVSFINRKNTVAFNPTLSIPISQLDKNPENYHQNIRTRTWPNGPDGEATPAMISVKQVLIFEESAHKENAMDFMAFLLQPENIGRMLKAMDGRFFPTMPELLADPFYSDTDDPHISAMYRQFTETENIPFPQARNHNYAKVMAERLWGKATGRVVLDGWTPEEAVDELAARMEEIVTTN